MKCLDCGMGRNRGLFRYGADDQQSRIALMKKRLKQMKTFTQH